MRGHSSHSYIPAATPTNEGQSPPPARSDWDTLKKLLPYLWRYKWRVLAALGFVLAAKMANLGVPILLKEIVDSLSLPLQGGSALLVVPLGLLIAYGLLRLSTSVFTELREYIFAPATYGTARSITLETFTHLHQLSLRYHLARQTGGMSRDIERGTRAVSSLISFSLYNIIPTLIELALMLGFLAWKFDIWFAAITLGALVLYTLFTIVVTEWRTQFRKSMNEYDSSAHSKAIDSLLNYETVKYFNNEEFERARYDQHLQRYQNMAMKSQGSLSLLNAGQQLIIGLSLVLMLWRATEGVVAGRMTLGDLVMINAFMIQIYIPLNFLGVVYREIKQSLTDLDKMFALLECKQEIQDNPDAQALTLDGVPEVRFENVHFAYEPSRPILHGISFTIPAGKTVAVVGSSGAGKSTLARLLYRFYDIQSGAIFINHHDIRNLRQHCLRRAIGIVPQDTVLFNDTIAYNIAYGKTDASQADIEAAAKAARIHDFIISTPKGYETPVGERGLKLSGGEKQRVAIARTLLKNPPILIFDEATSALDSANERAIQSEIQSAAKGKTTLVVAHRLSTVIHAHEILVMQAGRIIERGTHHDLLERGGEYAKMWALQHNDSPKKESPPHGNQMA